MMKFEFELLADGRTFRAYCTRGKKQYGIRFHLDEMEELDQKCSRCGGDILVDVITVIDVEDEERMLSIVKSPFAKSLVKELKDFLAKNSAGCESARNVSLADDLGLKQCHPPVGSVRNLV